MKSKIIESLKWIFRFIAPVAYMYMCFCLYDWDFTINGYNISGIMSFIALILIYRPVSYYVDSVIDNTSIQFKEDDEEWDDEDEPLNK